MSDPKNEEVERLAVVMVARRDQLKMADEITALKKRMKQLEECLDHYFGGHVKPSRPTPTRRKR